MKNLVKIAAILTAMISVPALADDMGIDTSDMTETASPALVNAFDLSADGFDLSSTTRQTSFMATMAASLSPDYRLQNQGSGKYAENNAGIVSLFVPEEFAYRSNAQDSGVDAIVPGQYLSQSVRPDFLNDNGPAANDKSSVGLRFGF